jgi:hypothetical protein
MDWTAASSVAEQDATRQVKAMSPMMFIVGPHWQPWSVSAQPALEIAEERQPTAQTGSLPKFWAVERVRRAARVRSWNFIVVVVLTGTIEFCGVICCLFGEVVVVKW